MGYCLFCSHHLNESAYSDVRDRLKISRKSWTFKRCQKCRSITLDPLPDPEESKKAYPPLYHYAQAMHFIWFHRFQDLMERKIFYEPIYNWSVNQIKTYTGLSKGRLCDVGGGAGSRSFFLKKSGFDVTVLDIDKRALQVAQERFGLNTIHGSLDTVDLPEEYFDIMTFFYVLEHLHNPAKALASAYKALRSSGWIVILVPLLNSYEEMIFKKYWGELRDAPRHTAIPTTRGVKYLLENNGFALKSWRDSCLLDNAGNFATSLLPSSANAIACTKSGVGRSLLRMLGFLITLSALPFVFIERISGHPRAGLFFAQKNG